MNACSDLFESAEHVLDRLYASHAFRAIVPAQDSTLGFTIPVPLTWAQAPILRRGSSPAAPEILAAFCGTDADEGARIIVSAKRLGYEVDPLAWLTYRWKWCGWKIVSTRHLRRLFVGRVELCGFRAEHGALQVRRQTAFLHDGALVCVDTLAPRWLWPKVQDALWPCGTCLNMASPPARFVIESRRTHRCSRFHLALPSSWEALSPRADRVRWTFKMSTPQFGGLLFAGAVSEANAQDHVQRLKHELSAFGVEVVGFASPQWFGDMQRSHGICAVDDQVCELRALRRTFRSRTVEVAALLPPLSRYPLDHMRTARALEVAWETMGVHDDVTATTERFDRSNASAGCTQRTIPAAETNHDLGR